MKKIIRPYQKEGIATITKWYKKHRTFLLADETGLGKSLQALKVLQNIMKTPKHNRAIIVCPAFLKRNWQNEINKWLPKNKKYSIVIQTYSGIIEVNALHYLTKYHYDMLIIDEGHYLKSFESQRTMAVYGAPGYHNYKPLIKCCRKVLKLTATPVPQRVGEIYPWLWATKHIIIKGVTYEGFIAKWAAYYKQTKFGITHKGVKNPEALKEALSINMLRRKKKDVLPDLPDFSREYITLSTTTKMYAEERELLTELLKATGYQDMMLNDLLNNPALLDSFLQIMPSFEKLSIFKKQQGLMKVKLVCDYLQNFVLNEKKKFILFCYHKDVAEQYLKFFQKQKLGIPITKIDGDVPVDERFGIIEKINEHKEHILIATMHSIKEGLNITGFDTSFFAEIDWAPYVLTQVEGRTLRIGQKNFVSWKYFLFDRGIEQYIFNMLEEKNDTVEKIVG